MPQSVNLQDLFEQYKREDEIVVLEPGTYRLEVLRATVRKGDKGPGILPVFKVVGGPYNGKTAMCGQFTASEAGRSIFFRQMAGFGLGEDFWRQGNGVEEAAKALAGRVVDAQVTVRPWQGQDRNNIAIGGITLVSAAADPVAAQFAQPAAPTTQAPPEAPPAVPSLQPAAPPIPTPAVPPAPPIPSGNTAF